jgi:hypothetical protein
MSQRPDRWSREILYILEKVGRHCNFQLLKFVQLTTTIGSDWTLASSLLSPPSRPPAVASTQRGTVPAHFLTCAHQSPMPASPSVDRPSSAAHRRRCRPPPPGAQALAAMAARVGSCGRCGPTLLWSADHAALCIAAAADGSWPSKV